MSSVVDAKEQVLRCENCMEEVPIPLGVVDWVTSVIQAFDRAHKNCKPGGHKGITGFSK